MPCADPSPSYLHSKFNERTARNNAEAATMLCTVCREMTEAGEPIEPQLLAWYKEHKEIDELRAQLMKTDSWFAYTHSSRT